MCKISIVVPVYNAELYVEDTVNSILAQTFADYELIIIDDGSADGSPQICDRLAEQDARVKVIHQPNGGVCAARNKGIELATGDFICFIDADDYIEPTMLQVLYDNAIEHNVDISCCGIVQTSLQGVSNDGYCTGTRRLITDMESLIKKFFTDPEYKEVLYGPNNKIIRADIVKAVGFDKRFRIGEDLLFNFRCLEQAKSFYFDNQGLYHYIKREGSATTSAFSEKRFDYIYVADILLDACRQNHPDAYQPALIWTYVHKLNMCHALKKHPEMKNKHPQFYQNCAAFCKQHKKAVWKRLHWKKKVKYLIYGV